MRDVTPDRPEQRMALDALFSAAYEELHRLAAGVRRGARTATLTPTTLVNEAWLKLARSPDFVAVSPLHFKRVIARAMRQVLVDAARRRRTDRRGRGHEFVTFDEALVASVRTDEQVLALDVALDALARLHPRQAAMVECRFFGGLDTKETAALLDVSEATVLRDWRAAKAWLALELRRAR
jgi:RNA polymerase sigma factor (TIGR02999 family)